MTTVSSTDRSGSIPVTLLRITLGLILIATWNDNRNKGLYTADGLKGFLDWLASPDGNDGSLGFVHSILDTIVVSNAGFFGPLQQLVELVIGVCLLVGLFTRLTALLAAGFFFSLFLAYFGGNEWIWTYVLLFMAALTVYLGFGGRRLGIDELLNKSQGDSPAGNSLW